MSAKCVVHGESEVSPLKFYSRSCEFGSSEYARAYTAEATDSSRSCPVSAGDARSATAIASLLRGADSEYNQSFGPKGPYSKPCKPEWMLNKYKSGFDLKSDPNAKFDGTTVYREAFLDKSSIPIPAAETETLYPHQPGHSECESVRASGTIVHAAGDSTADANLTAAVKERGKSSDINGTRDPVKKEPEEPEPDIKIMYSSFDDVNLRPQQGTDQDDLKIVSPPPPPMLPRQKSCLAPPSHSRRKVTDEPSLYATPALRHFMNSIRR